MNGLHPHWASLADFAAMGGYGGYVWGSVLVALAVLAGEQIAIGLRRRAAIERIHELRDARADDGHDDHAANRRHGTAGTPDDNLTGAGA
ncbi:heme exporter protein CcmD [Derxia gummosa]|uniref:Heme exporter protein D n=1 Tax=Derxia gummosa DSM 723 TaxID=1121388 RepID=A0A8B6XB96_9BURK|nr:heme exporter protein CcmD [Derxia gummosa]